MLIVIIVFMVGLCLLASAHPAASHTHAGCWLP